MEEAIASLDSFSFVGVLCLEALCKKAPGYLTSEDLAKEISGMSCCGRTLDDGTGNTLFVNHAMFINVPKILQSIGSGGYECKRDEHANHAWSLSTTTAARVQASHAKLRFGAAAAAKE